MIINHNGKRIKLLGDTHLGRRFVTNVPLHRRGDREKMVWDEFVKQLDPQGCDYHIHLGDLFDKPVVSLDLIFATYMAYREAATTNFKTLYLIQRGNHDASRDLERKTAFDLFAELVASIPTIKVVSDQAVELEPIKAVVFGWHPIICADDCAKGSLKRDTELVFGHWDVDARSDHHNLIPTRIMSEFGVKAAYTGHIHKPETFARDGVDVTVVGSMQPFAFGEEVNDDIYVTLSLEEARVATDLKNKHVRIDLQPGEVFDLSIDCLQLQVRKVEEVAADMDVDLGEFNLAGVYDEVATEFNLPAGIAEQVRNKWQEAFALQA